MKKIKEIISVKIKNYFTTKSKLSIATDFLFFALLVALVIPASRKEVMVFVKKATMMQPRINENKTKNKLSEQDYNWTYQTTDGQVKNFNDLKGKVVVLNFWATWCPPCVAEMPELQKLYDNYNGKVEFVFLSNEQPKTVEAFLKKEAFHLPVFLTYDAVPQILSKPSIPSTFVISRSGEVVISKTGSAKWNGEKVHELLDKLMKE